MGLVKPINTVRIGWASRIRDVMRMMREYVGVKSKS